MTLENFKSTKFSSSKKIFDLRKILTQKRFFILKMFEP